MRWFLSILAGCALLMGVAEASVTDVKWGVDAKQNLRFVVDLTEPADFTARVENQTLLIRVKSPLDGESRVIAVNSEFAKSMSIKAAGAETLVQVPLTQVIAREDIKTFTLKQDPVTQRPSRIVLDVIKKQAIPVMVAVNTAKVEVPKVNNEPKADNVVTVNSDTKVSNELKVDSEPKVNSEPGTDSATKTNSEPKDNGQSKSAEVPKVNPNINPKLIPASVLNSKGVQLADTKRIAKIPEIRKPSAKVQPIVPNISVAAPSVTPKTAVGPAVPESTKVQTPNVIVASNSAKSVKPSESKAVKEVKVTSSVTADKQAAPAVKSVLPGAVEKKEKKTEEKIEVKKEKIAEEQTELRKEKNVRKNKKGEYRTDGGVKGKVITIDPGHGGSDPGAVSKKGTYEKTITLSMAKKLKAELEKMGAVVYLTRTADVDVAGKNAEDAAELQARVDIAENHCSDLFISLHINASVNKKASGISTYYYAKSDYDGKLANCIHKQLTTNFGMNDMGVRQANFYVTKRCCMPAVLMELGFISNIKEEKTIKGSWFQDKAMDLIAKGIREYFK